MPNNTRELGIHPEKKSGKLIFSGNIPEYVWISNPKILRNHPGRIFSNPGGIWRPSWIHENFKFSTNPHKKCHVIPHFWIFWGKLIHFWCYFGDLTHILQNMVPQGVKYPNFSQNDPKYWYYANNFPIWTIR